MDRALAVIAAMITMGCMIWFGTWLIECGIAIGRKQVQDEAFERGYAAMVSQDDGKETFRWLNDY